jgi:tetratricopeptide (TPR) repeat protein
MRQETPPREQQAAPGRWQVGDKIKDRYEIHQILGGPGKSGMGIVYVCYDHQFIELVAIKTLQDEYLRKQAAIERFQWEAETWVRLEKHYNIVQAKYVQVIEGRPYIFLEYVVGDKQYGTDLSGWIWGGGLQRDGRADIPLVLNFAIQFCHGMIHAQNKFKEMKIPFVHRDVKPQNILITQDKVVKVTDFGLVKAFLEWGEDIPLTTVEEGYRRRPGLSKSGAICGTPPYMSPEQCRGEKDIDVRADVYAFGCVLYEMLTRRYVFDAMTPKEFIYHHLKSMPQSPNAHKELDEVVMKCLEKGAGPRYHDFEELEGALSRIYFGLTGEVIKPPTVQKLEAWELSNKGLSLANIGLLQDAITCYHQALRINPSLAEAHTNLGNACKDQGKLDAAVGEYREALRINPNDAGAHYNLGIAYKDQGKLDAAVGEYREALRINPSLAEAHYNLGIAYKAQGKLDAAVGEYREALRLNPSLAEAHSNLGNAYYAQGKLDAAVGEYREALRINPSLAEAHGSLGNAYYVQGKLDAAVLECREALRLNPSLAEAHYNLGNAYYVQGKLEAAVGEYREALRLNPSLAEAHYNLGIAYKAQGKLDAAVREYREALRLNPNYARAHTNLGNAYDAQGKLDAAVGEYRKALRINPNDAGAHYNLGIAYKAQGKLDAAVGEYREALRINPNDAEAHLNLGIAYKAQGKLDAAVGEYREALRINPNDAEAHLNLGIAYKAQGKFKEAIGCYQAFVRLAPPQYESYVRQAEKDIRELRQKI